MELFSVAEVKCAMCAGGLGEDMFSLFIIYFTATNNSCNLFNGYVGSIFYQMKDCIRTKQHSNYYKNPFTLHTFLRVSGVLGMIFQS